MASFLKLLAKDLVRLYGTDFSRLTVIFPNKRAGLFLSEELSRYIDRPVWMPQIITLSEYIEKQTGLKKAGNLPLIIKLYKAYNQIAGIAEKFEDFYFWGNMLLEDFDNIDKYQVDAAGLFTNLANLKEVELNFPYLSPEQVEAIRQFWSSFNPEKFSREQQEFLKVWDRLHPTYATFKKNLAAENICYEGMNERLYCERIAEYEHPEQLVIAGFNALSECQKKIFAFYRDLGNTHFYWDYDLYYTSREHHEAGYYIRENLRHFPNELGIEHFNNFLHNDKQIEYISVPSAIGQAKLIAALTDRISDKNPRQTAIVLCDEPMLIPAIHSIPAYMQKINVTMGYPAQKTSVAALLSLLCDLKNYIRKEGNDIYYYYKPVIALLNHKLIKELCPEEIYRITNGIHQKNIVYIAAKSLDFHELIRTVFNSDEASVPDYLLKILHILLQTSREQPLDPIEKEFIFSIYTQIQNLRNTFEEEHLVPEDKLYAQLISKIIGHLTIPFSGEPLEGLQLMGLMETRMLDFRHLIILSANEGILPKTALPASFIPYNLRVGFGLPTPEQQDALFAYYFYRLLQRAQDIKILYASGNKGNNSGEMSRFLYQIKYESGLPVQESSFQNRIAAADPQPICIGKNEAVLKQLERFCLSEETMISPSALNTYMECPLKFYFKYIARIEEKEEIAEELDHRLLGNIFHECSQTLYATVPDGHITAEAIDRLLADETLMERHIRQAYLHVYDAKISRLIGEGSNDLILNVVKKYLHEMFAYDRRFCPFDLLAMETRFHVPVEIQASGRTRKVFVGGFIDRVDCTASGIRIIDYKTGSDNTTFKNLDSVFDSSAPTRNKAAFQTMLYCLMYDHVHPTNHPLIPGIYSTKLLFGKDYDYRLKCDKEVIADFRPHEEKFKALLTELTEKLFSPELPFRQTENDKKCRNCKYAAICRK